jgi:hypothetical protein
MTRRGVIAAVACALLAAGAGTAGAQARKAPPLTGDWEVTFQVVGNTCDRPVMNLRRGTFTFEQKARRLTVSFPMIPFMRGTADGKGAFRAAARRGGTAVQGIDGEFKVSGTATDGKLQLVLVADYFVRGRPHCQQSWSAEGSRSAAP